MRSAYKIAMYTSFAIIFFSEYMNMNTLKYKLNA